VRHPPHPARRLLFALGLIGATLLAYRLAWHPTRPPLVVYCAHDAVHAEQLLRQFERETGIPLEIHYDTEATKSLGLVELIRKQSRSPRCDVFWNNELLGSVDLADRGLLQPYKGPGHARIPTAYKDPAGRWTGFGARLRVYILHDTQTRPDLNQPDLSRMAIAKPLYGTTLTHYTVLWKLWGPERLKQWHRDWRRRGVKELPGNAAVKNLVATGACGAGLTDTDDYFAARDAGQPVAMRPFTLRDGRAILIPNTVSILRGTRRGPEAQRLVDYLLSRRTELALARGRARQLPLGPVDDAPLPPEVRALLPWVRKSVPLAQLGPARSACLAWLKQEYAR